MRCAERCARGRAGARGACTWICVALPDAPGRWPTCRGAMSRCPVRSPLSGVGQRVGDRSRGVRVPRGSAYGPGGRAPGSAQKSCCAGSPPRAGKCVRSCAVIGAAEWQRPWLALAPQTRPRAARAGRRRARTTQGPGTATGSAAVGVPRVGATRRSRHGEPVGGVAAAPGGVARYDRDGSPRRCRGTGSVRSRRLVARRRSADAPRRDVRPRPWAADRPRRGVAAPTTRAVRSAGARARARGPSRGHAAR